MNIEHSQDKAPVAVSAAIQKAVGAVSAARLRRTVEALAFPRHFTQERDANRRAREWITEELRSLGYLIEFQGPFDNVLAHPTHGRPGGTILLGAHYDSVPHCPGADDNASAVAVCLECAHVLHAVRSNPATFVFFNREEDGLLGSRDFVKNGLHKLPAPVREAHVFEMVGFRSKRPGSQKAPSSLPITLPDAGDFLGLLVGGASGVTGDALLRLARTYTPHLPAVALTVPSSLATQFPDLLRSDHVPFWEAGLPAVMWTDTSEFRNPHYHKPTDTAETLDFDFMADIARLAVASVFH